MEPKKHRHDLHRSIIYINLFVYTELITYYLHLNLTRTETFSKLVSVLKSVFSSNQVFRTLLSFPYFCTCILMFVSLLDDLAIMCFCRTLGRALCEQHKGYAFDSNRTHILKVTLDNNVCKIRKCRLSVLF